MSGQYVAYTFFRVDPAWRRLPIEERSAGKEAFADVVEDWAGRMTSLRAYSVTGVRPAQSSTTSAKASLPALRSSIGRRRQAESILKKV